MLSLLFFEHLHLDLILLAHTRVGLHQQLGSFLSTLGFFIGGAFLQNGLFVHYPIELTVIFEGHFSEQGLE